MYSRFEENKLTYFESDNVQNNIRLASKRSITESTGHNEPGKLLPASFHGSPLNANTTQKMPLQSLTVGAVLNYS